MIEPRKGGSRPPFPSLERAAIRSNRADRAIVDRVKRAYRRAAAAPKNTRPESAVIQNEVGQLV